LRNDEDAETGTMSRVHETARVAEDVVIGDFVVIEPNVSIRGGSRIGNHVTICADTVIGADCVVADFAVLGKRPQLAASSTAKGSELPGVVVGDGCRIGSHTVLMAGSRYANRVVVGDSAGVRERCVIGDDVVVGRSVTVENDTSIGSRTKIQSGAYITAYMTIEEDVFIAPMVVTTNDNYMGRTEKRFAQMRGATIRRGARIGGGAHLLPGIEIGEEAFVATASVVTKDVPARSLVMGSPARVVREVPNDELLENR